MLPIVFGSDLLGGNVIWSSNFKLNQFVSAAGLQYYWTVSFAMALCEGPLDALLRIYVGDLIVLDNVAVTNVNGTIQSNANGQVNNVAVDFTTPDSPLRALPDQQRNTRITLFDGSSSQIPKSIMSDDEGYDLSPGYRGVGFILFENLVVQDNIPQITIEVSANTVSPFPRQYGTIPDIHSGSVLGGRSGTFLAYDPGYDVFYMSADDAPLNGGTPATQGVVIFDGNTLQPLHECVFQDPNWETSIFAPSGPGIFFDGLRSLLLPSTGNLLLDCGTIGSGQYFIVNPWSNRTLDRIEAEASLGAHTSAGPAATQQGNHVSLAYASDGVTVEDMVPILSLGFAIFGHGPNFVGFLNCTAEGKFTWHDYTNSPANIAAGLGQPWVRGFGECMSITYNVQKSVSDATPAFPDGEPTAGQHIYYFSYDGANNLGFFVDRASVSPPNTVDTPRYSPAADFLSMENFGGFGSPSLPQQIFVDPADNCIVFMFGLSPMYAVKYDPMTGAIVWRTAIDSRIGNGPFRNQDASRPLINNHTYAWMEAGTGAKIWTLDLQTGVAQLLTNLEEQGLPPAPVGDYTQYYNGNENSLTYTTDRAVTPSIVKVFLGRKNRAQVPLVDIITKLLGRVDWSIADTIIDDISTIALDGYTVTSVEQIREVFSDLQQVFTFDIVESNGRILYKSRGEAPTITIDETSLGGQQGQSGPWLTETHDYDFANTRKLNLTYRDIDMQYKSNVQSVMLPKYNHVAVDGDAPIDVQIGIVMSADEAKRLAEILLYSKLTYETAYDGGLPQGYTYVDPSDVVTFRFDPKDGLEDVVIRMRTVAIGQDKTVTFNATREDPDIYADQVDLFGTLGRFIPPVIPPVTPRVDPFFLPIGYRSDSEAQQNDASPLAYPIYYTLLNTRPTPVPTQKLLMSVDDNPVITSDFVNFPTWGYCLDTLLPHPNFYSTEFKGVIRVQLLSGLGAELGSLPDYYAMLNDRHANLALIGNELIQFQTVTALGNNIIELSVLSRCLFNTEDAHDKHLSGDRFILLSGTNGLLNSSIIKVKTPIDVGPTKIVSMNVQSTNPYQPLTGEQYTSIQFKPRQPGAGKIENVAGDAVLTWKYCARYNGQWTEDGTDANDVVFEDSDGTVLFPTYDVYLTRNVHTFNKVDASTYLRKVSLANVLTFTYTAAMQTADGFNWNTDVLGAAVIETNSKTGFEVSSPALFYRGNI